MLELTKLAVVTACTASVGLLVQGLRASGPSSTWGADGPLCVVRALPQNMFTRVLPPPELQLRVPMTDAVTIDVTYTGFTAEAQAAFQHAINIWQAQLTSTVPIRVNAEFTVLAPGVLGSAGATNYWSNFPGATFAATWFAQALANKLHGSQLDPGSIDIDASFNSSFTWYYGTDANTPAGQYDFVSVVLHELTHGLGFAGFMTVSGGIGSWGYGTGYPNVYDRFVENGAAQSLLNTTLFPNYSTALAAQLTGNSLYWNGPNGVSANSGIRPRIYAPDIWQPGSSYSHLDEVTYPAGDVNSLMTYAIGAAEAIHDPGPIVRGMFTDTGWTTSTGCSYSIDPESAGVGAGGGTGTVTVTAGAGCAWTAMSNDPGWLTVTSGSSGTGNGTVDYAVAPNGSPAARSGTLTIAERTFTVTQAAALTRIINLSGDLAFGSTPVNTTATRTLTIGNSGNSTLTVTGIGYPTAFTGAWTGTVAPGGSQDVTVTFAPTAATGYGGTVTVIADQTAGTNTIAASGTGIVAPTGGITGTVTDADTTAPLSGLMVRVYDAGGTPVLSAYTNASGQYSFDGLAAGTYFSRTDAYGYSTGYIDELYDDIPCVNTCDVTGGTAITVAAGGTTGGIDFELTEGGRIAGTVTDSVSGAPLVDLSVYHYTADGSYVLAAHTDAAGHYISYTGLPAGTYFVRTADYSGVHVDELYDDIPCTPSSCTVTSGTPIAVTLGTTTGDVDFVLARKETTRVSVSSGGAQGDDDSTEPAVSADGRWVAFVSGASTLVADDTNGASDAFVHDRVTGSTTRVSLGPGGAQANGNSSRPSITADGRWVTFSSEATNLVLDDTNAVDDVFVHDMHTGSTTRVSVGAGDVQANGASSRPVMSADGRWVAFVSAATNLTPGDTNARQDVFVRDVLSGTTTLVSAATNGTQGNDDSWAPAISADGRWVAFYSSASNLVTGDTNSVADVFVHDRQEGTTTRGSVATDGAQGNDHSGYPAISADGRWVAFGSYASNLVASDTNGYWDVFVRDREAGTTTRVSVGSGGVQGNLGAWIPALSADGRWVTFTSEASNLVPDDTNGHYDVFVHDRQTGMTERVSVAPDSGQGDDDSASYDAAISADGRWVAFYSLAGNLVTADTNGAFDVFLRDRGDTGCAVTLAPNAGSAPAGGSDGYVLVLGQADCAWTALSSDPGWLSVTEGSPGTGFGTVRYSVAPNASFDDRTGTLTIGGQTFTLTQAGIVPTRVIGLAGNLGFGSVTVGMTATRTLTIDNGGNSPLTVTGIDYPAGFSGSWSGAIAAGGSQDVTVTFAPIAAVSYGGTVTVTADQTGGSNTISASGTGTSVPTRVIGLSGNLAFGSVPVNTTATRTLTISNSGNSVLTVGGIDYPAGFSGAWSGTVAAGSSQDVTVTFAPTAETSYGGTVTVDADETGGTDTIDVSGTGSAELVTLALTPSALSYAAVNDGGSLTAQTGAQTVTVNQSDGPGVAWTVTPSAPWIQVSPASGTGNATFTVAIVNTGSLPATGTMYGTVTVSSPGAANAPVVDLSLTLHAPGTSVRPLGVLDWLYGDTTVSGSIVIGGWVVDDVEVSRVEVYRDRLPGEPLQGVLPLNHPGYDKIYIATAEVVRTLPFGPDTALFVDGARPDIEAMFPSYPWNYRAGWGYLMLTWGLPNQGTGTYTIHAYAFDRDGTYPTDYTRLGTRTFTSDNRATTPAARKPFGAIDVPFPGETVSGITLTGGWGLTQPVTCEVTDVWVGIDSAPLEPVIYGDPKPGFDVFFPPTSFADSPDAGIAYFLDSTLLTNGLHQIGYLVQDSCGHQDGIGSRFFSVLNGTSAVAANSSTGVTGQPVTTVTAAPTDTGVVVTRGYVEQARSAWRPPELVAAGTDGARVVRTRPLERIALALPPGEATGAEWTGHLVVRGQLRPLPVGASLDARVGVFYWVPGPGFLGRYDLLFVSTDRMGAQVKVPVRVEVGPAVR